MSERSIGSHATPTLDWQEIQFVAMAADKSGTDAELGVARLSLEGLLAKGADAVGPLPLKNNAGEVIGQVTCALTALAAMRNIAAEFDGWLVPPAGAAKKAAVKAAEEVKRDEITVRLGKVALKGRLARKPPPYVNASIEFPEARPESCPVVPTTASNASADLAFSKTFQVPLESGLRGKLFKVLASRNLDDNAVHVTVFSAERPNYKSGTFLGNGSFTLHDLLQKQEELKDHQVRRSQVLNPNREGTHPASSSDARATLSAARDVQRRRRAQRRCGRLDLNKGAADSRGSRPAAAGARRLGVGRAQG